MKNLIGALLLIAVSSMTAGCGGDSGSSNTIGGPSCGVGPCGGDVVGTWNVTDICLSRSILMSTFAGELMGSCPGASVGNSDAGPSGLFVFNTDSTYSLDFTMTLSLGMNFPLSCFPAGTTCADLDAAFKQQAAGDPSITSTACAGSGTCACTIVEAPRQITESGTYSVSGSSLLTTPTGGAADTQGYCVKDKNMTFSDTTPDPQNPVTAIVVTKP